MTQRTRMATGGGTHARGLACIRGLFPRVLVLMAMVPFVPGLGAEPAVKTARCSKAEFTKSRRSAEKLYREGHYSDAVEVFYSGLLISSPEEASAALTREWTYFVELREGRLPQRREREIDRCSETEGVELGKRLTWRQVDPKVRFEPDSHHKEGLRVEGHLVSGYLGKWALGDFNGDDVEDVLLVRSMGPEDGSAFDITTFLLTRTRPGGVVTILERME